MSRITLTRLSSSVFKAITALIFISSVALFSGCTPSEFDPSDNASGAATSETTAVTAECTEAPTTAAIAPEIDNPFVMPEEGVRPIAVMIDNEGKFSYPQGGIYKAQIVYEMLVEYGETRLMPLYWGKAPEMIGPVRSSRHYFLDYVLEHDAIYVHYGWSPMAQRDISALRINNMNGVGYGGEVFWELTRDKRNWQDTYTSYSKLIAFILKAKYRIATDKQHVFGYLEAKGHDQDTAETTGDTGSKTATSAASGQDTGSKTATSAPAPAPVPSPLCDARAIKIVYSKWYSCGYEYDIGTDTYIRMRNNSPHLDRYTEEPLRTTNIIIQYVQNALINGDTMGRQDLKTVGSGKGFYIVSGNCYPIKWTKKDRSSCTQYMLEDGQAVLLKPGATWIQIVPMYSEITINP